MYVNFRYFNLEILRDWKFCLFIMFIVVKFKCDNNIYEYILMIKRKMLVIEFFNFLLSEFLLRLWRIWYKLYRIFFIVWIGYFNWIYIINKSIILYVIIYFLISIYYMKLVWFWKFYLIFYLLNMLNLRYKFIGIKKIKSEKKSVKNRNLIL